MPQTVPDWAQDEATNAVPDWAQDDSAPAPAATAAPAQDEPSFRIDPQNPDDADARNASDIETLVASGVPRTQAGRVAAGLPLDLPPTRAQLSAVPWHDQMWGDFRHGHLGRFLLGPTDEEKAQMAQGQLAGPPGGDPGLVPLALTAPSPFLPGPEKAAGKVLLGMFVAQNLKSQPERIAEINRKLQSGDTKGAYHDILGDFLDTGMTLAAAHDLHGEVSKSFETPSARAGRMLGEQVDGSQFMEPNPDAIAGGVARTPEVDAILRQGYQPAPTVKDALVPTVSGVSGKPREPNPTVPETAPEPERSMNVLEEIRAQKAQTIRQIQELYPKAELTREQARDLRNQAWGPPEQPAPKTEVVPDWAQIPEPESEPVNETEQPQDEPQPEDFDPNAGAQPEPEANTLPEAAASPAPNPPALVDPYAELRTALRDPSTGQMIVGEKGQDHYTIYNQLSPEGKDMLGLDKPTNATRENNYDNRGWMTEDGRFVTLRDLKGAGGDIAKAVADKPRAPVNEPAAPKSGQQIEDDNERLIRQSRAVAAVQSGKDYRPAVRTKDGTVLTGNEHNAISDKLPKNQQRAAQNGYVDKSGNFLTLLDVARREMEKNAPPSEPATAPPAAKGKAKPVKAPAQAAAKVEDHVNTVAATEGQRPAKEVKTELVARLEAAIAAAPSEKDLAFKRGYHNPTKGEMAASREGQPSITIKIPGTEHSKLRTRRRLWAKF